MRLIAEVANELRAVYPEHKQAHQCAVWLLSFVSGQEASRIVLQGGVLLTSEQKNKLVHCLQELVEQQKPLAYVLGSIPFLSLDIAVVPPVLIPRPETEWWTAFLLEHLKKNKKLPRRVADICTGSGCIGLAIAQAYPQAEVILVDLAPQACTLAKQNAERNQLDNVTVQRADLCTQLTGRFDLITTNPPYVPAAAYETLDPSVRLWEDRKALVSPAYDTACIDDIIQQARDHLLPKAQLWIEIDVTQAVSAVSQARRHGYRGWQVKKDQYQRDRVIVLER